MCVSVPWGKRHSFRKKKKKKIKALHPEDFSCWNTLTGPQQHESLQGAAHTLPWEEICRGGTQCEDSVALISHSCTYTHTLCDPGLIRTSQNTLFLQGVSPLQWHLGMCSTPACACFKMDWCPYLFSSDLSTVGFVWGPVKRRQGDIIWRTADLFDLQKTAYGQLPSFTTKQTILDRSCSSIKLPNL